MMRIIKRIMTVGIAVVVVLLGYAIVYPVFHKGHSPAKVNICDMYIRELSGDLYCYAHDTGYYPDSRKWIQTLKHFYAGTIIGKRISEGLKCPCDNTSSKCSYVMNPALSGKSFKSIPKTDRERIYMIREKHFPGSHGWVRFADMHPERKIVESRE